MVAGHIVHRLIKNQALVIFQQVLEGFQNIRLVIHGKDTFSVTR